MISVNILLRHVSSLDFDLSIHLSIHPSVHTYISMHGTHVLPVGYVWDDRAAIVSNADVHGTTSLLELLQHDFWGQDITLKDSHKVR